MNHRSQISQFNHIEGRFLQRALKQLTIYLKQVIDLRNLKLDLFDNFFKQSAVISLFGLKNEQMDRHYPNQSDQLDNLVEK